MTKINSIDLKNNKIDNPEIDIVNLHQVIKSPGNNMFNLRFVLVNTKFRKSEEIFWLFDNEADRDHNFILVTKAMEKEFYVNKQ